MAEEDTTPKISSNEQRPAGGSEPAGQQMQEKSSFQKNELNKMEETRKKYGQAGARFRKLFGENDKQYKMPKNSEISQMLVNQVNVGTFIKRNDDGSVLYDGEAAFIVQREYDTNIAYAIFQKPGKINKLLRRKIQKYFNSSLAAPNSKKGYNAWFDAESYEQTVPTSDLRVSQQVALVNNKLTNTIKGMILSNTIYERLRNQNSFLEKYLPHLLIFFAVIILAILIYISTTQMASAIDKLGTIVKNLGSGIASIPSASSTGLPAV